MIKCYKIQIKGENKMDLDDDELKATRELHKLNNERKNIFEDLEILINSYYSNCCM